MQFDPKIYSYTFKSVILESVKVKTPKVSKWPKYSFKKISKNDTLESRCPLP